MPLVVPTLSASDAPVNVCVIGYGLSAKVFHIPYITVTPGLKLHSVVQRDISTEDVSKDHPGVKRLSSIDEIYTNEEIQLVVLGTSNQTHYKFTKDLLEHGKDVVVEKPFTVTSKEADELCALAKSNGRILSVFHNRRWDADFQTLLKIIKSPQVGTPVHFSTFYNRFQTRASYEANRSPAHWKKSQTPGSGMLFDLGSHLLDQVIVLFGMPDRVFGIVRDERGVSQNPKAKWGEEGYIDDCFSATLFYDKPRAGRGAFGVGVQNEAGLVVSVGSNTLSARSQQERYVLRGTEGSWVKYGVDPQEPQIKGGMKPGDEGFGVESEGVWGELTTEKESTRVKSEVGDYGKFYEGLRDALIGKGELGVKAEEARDVIRLIEVIAESARDAKVVSL